MNLSEQILLNIMMFVGYPEMDKLKIITNKYFELENRLIKYIMSKTVKRSQNNHVLIEVNPRRKISFISNNEIEIEKQFRYFFFKNDNMNNWIQDNL